MDDFKNTLRLEINSTTLDPGIDRYEHERLLYARALDFFGHDEFTCLGYHHVLYEREHSDDFRNLDTYAVFREESNPNFPDGD